MTDTTDERALGRVEGKLDYLVQQQEAAERSRRHTHDQLETVARKQIEIQHDLKNVTTRLVAVEGPVVEFQRWRERWLGAMMLVGFMFTGVGMVVSYIVNWAVNYFSR